jgi:ADP-heptose:LPS heptosyltransferase
VPRLIVGASRRAEASERLGRAHVDEGVRPLVGVYPGTAGGMSGAPWPRGRFEELLRELRRHGMSAIVLATTEDLWPAVRVYEETGKIHPVIGPDLNLEMLAALLSRLDLVVASDSWMLQLAAAVGTPTVGLFARDPRRWGPQGPRHRPIGTRRGEWLRSIATASVFAAVEELMQETGDAVA